MDYSDNFITQDQVQKAIELPFSDVSEFLEQYIYYKGLVYTPEKNITYVNGYFIKGDTKICSPQFTREQIENDYHLTDPDMPVAEVLITMKGSKFSNKEELLEKELSLKSSQEIEKVWYSYKHLCELMDRFDCPPPKAINELHTKEYRYDVNLVNQKSNFTLEDAAKIAANEYSTDQNQFVSQLSSPLRNHYLELLSDCIKGTNQHNFKLHTIELWCSNYDESGERYSRYYDNGTYLKQKAVLDYQLTIISKQEFIRWCEYQNVDTGLKYEFKVTSDSIEALQCENSKLRKELAQLQEDKLDKEKNKEKKKLTTYPPELRLAIDAYEELCLDKGELPSSKITEKWLKNESEKRNITHRDGAKQLKGLSNKKIEALASVIRSQ